MPDPLSQRGIERPAYLLLLLLDFFSPPWLLRLLLRPELARSLFCILALPPLPAAWARLLPLLEEDADFDLRAAIDISFDVARPAHHARSHSVTLEARLGLSVSCGCAFL
jgi:hypothetical protein